MHICFLVKKLPAVQVAHPVRSAELPEAVGTLVGITALPSSRGPPPLAAGLASAPQEGSLLSCAW